MRWIRRSQIKSPVIEGRHRWRPSIKVKEWIQRNYPDIALKIPRKGMVCARMINMNDMDATDINRWMTLVSLLNLRNMQNVLAHLGLDGRVSQHFTSIEPILFESTLSLSRHFNTLPYSVEGTDGKSIVELLRTVADISGIQDRDTIIEWGERTFVNQEERERWWAWDIVFRRFTEVQGLSSNRQSLPILMDNDEVYDIVLVHYGPSAHQREAMIMERIARTAAIPPDELWQLGSSHEWDEFIRTYDFIGIDIALECEAMLDNQRSFETVVELMQLIGKERRDELLRWGKAQTKLSQVVGEAQISLAV
jgi:hypothetical protein